MHAQVRTIDPPRQKPIAPIRPASTSSRSASRASAALRAGTPKWSRLPAYPADEHPCHADRSVPAPEEVDAEGRIALPGETAADVADVVAQPRGFVDHDHAGMRSRAVREGQVRILERLGPHGSSLRRTRRLDQAMDQISYDYGMPIISA